MTQTDIANLALSKIGESLIDDIDDTGDNRARKAKLHYEPCLREILRAHFWGFAMGVAEMTPNAKSYASATINPTGADNSVLFTAVEPGPAGREISITYASPAASEETAVSVTDSAITVTPGTLARMSVTADLDGTGAETYDLLYAGTDEGGTINWTVTGVLNESNVAGFVGLYVTPGDAAVLYMEDGAGGNTGAFDISPPDETNPALLDWSTANASFAATGTPTVASAISSAAQVIAAVNADTDTSALVTAAASGTVTGAVAAVAETHLASGLVGWARAFDLPSDFLKLRKVLDPETADTIDKFDFRRIDGTRCLVTGDWDEVAFDYVQFVDDPDAYDPAFVTAFSTLLAARLARAISGSEKAEGDLIALYQNVDLPAARTADGHDSQSNENHPLKEFLKGSLTGSRADFFTDLDQ